LQFSACQTILAKSQHRLILRRKVAMEATVKEIRTGKIISSPSPATADNGKIRMGAIKPALSA
jgi:hypothetical protein